MGFHKRKFCGIVIIFTLFISLLSPQGGVFAAGLISLSTIGSPYTQNFDTLAIAGTSTITPNGWYFHESGTNANGLPGLFAGLHQLKWGDRIIIHAWGQRHVYEVREAEESVRPDDASVLASEDHPWLTLITCRGYDEESDTYHWRVVVRAVQVPAK